MFDATERIAYLSKVAQAKKELRFKDLFKIIQRTEFLEHAYFEIQGNSGSNTAGIDRVTKRSLNEQLEAALETLSLELTNGTYQPLPVRRVEIPKANGGKRPLGIPALKDRIVQSAVKIILETIYEPVFLNTSHGFRPKRSCQTAVNDIVSRKYDWVIEGDIRGCFDNIKHGKLLDLLRKRIADESFIQLINKFLKSGYQMGYGINGKYPVFESKNGTPQGGIVSPTLANIYLHEFDKHMEQFLCVRDEKQVKASQEYMYFNNKIKRLMAALRVNQTTYRIFFKEDLTASSTKGKLTILRNREEMIDMLRKLRKERRQYPHEDQEQYFNIKSFGYVRYADDFVILLGNYRKEFAGQFKEQIRLWFNDELNLNLSDEKTKITHATEGITFLGYDMIKRPNESGIGYKDNFSQVYVPRSRMNRVIDKMDKLLHLHGNSDAGDIIIGLNRIITGWSQYYLIANNWNTVSGYLDDILFWKMMHWLGRKHKSSIPKIIDKYVKKTVAYGKHKNRIVVSFDKKKIILKNFRDFKYETPKVISDKVKYRDSTEAWHRADLNDNAERTISQIMNGNSPTAFIQLAETEGRKCAICGSTEKGLIVHHTRMIKRNQRVNGAAVRQAAKALPKMLVCRDCEKEIHPNYQVSQTPRKRDPQR
ncbi:group II intron reverse transcriptase/maturase [Paenibacillus polymyxa]|uniref:group II intron reverse transcriptase/maturase n=1 Tax=Paenibacillus polymyxa TaxID=1406 RepID=UPI003217B6C1